MSITREVMKRAVQRRLAKAKAEVAFYRLILNTVIGDTLSEAQWIEVMRCQREAYEDVKSLEDMLRRFAS